MAMRARTLLLELLIALAAIGANVKANGPNGPRDLAHQRLLSAQAEYDRAKALYEADQARYEAERNYLGRLGGTQGALGIPPGRQVIPRPPDPQLYQQMLWAKESLLGAKQAYENAADAKVLSPKRQTAASPWSGKNSPQPKPSATPPLWQAEDQSLRKNPPQEKSPPTAVVGKPAPAFSMETLPGKKLSNEELKGNPATVLNFVASNCGFSKKQISRIEKIRQEYTDRGVRFVNVSETLGKKHTADAVVAVMKEVGPGFELAYDPENKIGGLFKVSSYPTMIVLGMDGNIEAIIQGNIADLESRLKQQLDALISCKSESPTTP